MKYKNLNAEMARKGMTKEDLTRKINEAGYQISYGRLCRQLRGETIIPFQEAGIISKIMDHSIEYLLEE